MDLSFTDRGMRVGPDFLPLYSGAFHYWRVERRLWPGILRKIREMGFDFVETYVPWSVHELEKCVFDFGRVDANKDLDAFLGLCEEEGLKAILRPGPHINAEISLFGYPDRVVYDPEIQARSPWGTPVMLNIVLKQFPLPSYASEKFFAETAEFFAAPRADHQAPRGPQGRGHDPPDRQRDLLFLQGPGLRDGLLR